RAMPIGPVAWAIAPLCSCADPDTTRPELEDARFADPGTVVLRFSEPIASVADVDPSGHFRLGAALVIDDLEGGELTVYYDLAHHFPDGVPGAGSDAAGPWFRHAFTTVAAIERGDDPHELRLLLSYPLEQYVCDALAEAATLGIPAAIHVHYAEGSYPRVTDEAGNPLADIGAWWVSESFATTIPGAFPELDPRLPIPCP
ncbi:MAG TPA: hypothetical protein VK034_11785, partial [Enhygromyxa sp.]|nr:hypothetical protein [Enhygromyxa sp.]